MEKDIPCFEDDGSPSGSSEVKLSDSLLCQALPFCPECERGLQGLPQDAPDRVRLRHQAVRFAVTLLEGLQGFISDTAVHATEECLRIDAQFRTPVAGEVATRSKVPVEFQVALRGKVGFTIAEKDGAVRCEISQGSLLSFPVEGAVEAGNQFFGDIGASGGGIGEATVADADRIALKCLDWWFGRGDWQERSGKRYAGTKLDMIFTSLAGSKAGSAVPKQELGLLLLGSMCVTPQEFAAFEFTVAPDQQVLLTCETAYVQEAGLAPCSDNFAPWRNVLAQRIKEGTISWPIRRRTAEQFALSATNFVVMCSSKSLGLRPAQSESVIRLFSVCRCPATASRWDPTAQSWQKTKDTTYSCAGSKEGRIVWRTSTLGLDIAAPDANSVGRDRMSFCAALTCCYKPRSLNTMEGLEGSSPISCLSQGSISTRSVDSRSRRADGVLPPPPLQTPQLPMPQVQSRGPQRSLHLNSLSAGSTNAKDGPPLRILMVMVLAALILIWFQGRNIFQLGDPL